MNQGKLNVTIVDYGMGNLLSVKRAVEYCGSKAIISNDPKIIEKSEKVILPGVGAFAVGMKNLKKNNLINSIKEVQGKEKPILGICLGMQMLLEKSYEYGVQEGLGIFKGNVLPIEGNFNSGSIKVPHIGWMNLQINKHKINFTPFRNINEDDCFYFNHSYWADVENNDYIIAKFNYGKLKLTSIIGKDNIWGCQFHPEKSGLFGLKIIKSFIQL